jgi:hypothetical protein
MNSNVTVRLVVSATLPIVIALIGKWMPYREKPADFSELPLEELQRRYAKWELFATLPLIVFTTLFGVLFYFLFRTVRDALLPGVGPGQILLLPHPGVLALPAGFLGLMSSAMPTHWLLSYLLKDRYSEYTHYCNKKVGFDSWRVLRWMTVGIVVICVVVMPPMFDWYVLCTDQGIDSNDYFSIGTRHHDFASLREVRRIAKFKAPNGKILDKPYFQLVFQDGYLWSSRDMCVAPDLPGNEAVAQFAGKHGGKPITPYDFAPDQK